MKNKPESTTNSIVKAGLILATFFFLGNEIIRQISRDLTVTPSTRSIMNDASKIGAATEEYNRNHPAERK